MKNNNLTNSKNLLTSWDYGMDAYTESVVTKMYETEKEIDFWSTVISKCKRCTELDTCLNCRISLLKLRNLQKEVLENIDIPY